jgi:hypothetical protein
VELETQGFQKHLLCDKVVTQPTIGFPTEIVHVCMNYTLGIDSFLQKTLYLLVLVRIEICFGVNQERVNILIEVLALWINIKCPGLHRIVIIFPRCANICPTRILPFHRLLRGFPLPLATNSLWGLRITIELLYLVLLRLKEILRGDLILEPILPILVGDSTLGKRLPLVVETLPLPLFINVWVLSRLHIGFQLPIKFL